MNASFAILSTNIYIYIYKVFFCHNKCINTRQNEEIVVIKYNGSIIAAGTEICCKLEHHFLNTRLKRNKYFMILACLWRGKKITSECLLKVVFETEVRLREEAVAVGLKCGPQMLNRCKRFLLSWHGGADADVRLWWRSDLRSAPHCSGAFSLCWMWEISRTGSNSWKASWM